MDAMHRTEGLLGQLIAYPTVSADSNRGLIDWAADHLTHLGARCEVMQDDTGTKANLWATFGPEQDGGLVLSGHSDVVPAEEPNWTSDPFTMVERDDNLYGRGTCDMKGFIACVMAMAPEFAGWELKKPIHIALTYDEEVGCYGARDLVAALTQKGVRPAMALLGEPTLMRVIDGHKGCCEYTTHFHGREGHASAPDKGVNAASYATRYASKLLSLEAELRGRAPADSPFDPPWSTINIGRITAGAARNVIASQAEIEWEMRPVTPRDTVQVLAEIDRYGAELLAEMQARDPAANVLREVIGEVAGLVPEDRNRMAEIACALTGANGCDVVSFGTEAGLFQSLGTQCVVCGPGSIEQAHRADEFVARSELAACLDMLAGVQRYMV
ncbi:acetylornithine deacetylase [Sagittula sp. NFXS13]|uniref:acetylornithine deacetylase n=1 Tax=Sagittula sp. NFXS13 TaxID=2819095 RepID=UPI0032DE5E76